MNRWLLVLLFVTGTNILPAQSFFGDSAYVRMANFPQPDNQKIAERHRANDLVYLFSPMDVYNLFPADSVYLPYRNFDFEQYHILGRLVCQQCFWHCRHENGIIEPCHRNRCSYSWMWVVRSNKKAFDTLSSRVTTTTKNFPGIYDTIVQPQKTADSGLAHWYTTFIGDCHARFGYSVITDKYFPVTLLLETDEYGGCRAAKFLDMDISFTPRAGKQFYRKAGIQKENNKRR